jgi:hypothetical protein
LGLPVLVVLVVLEETVHMVLLELRAQVALEVSVDLQPLAETEVLHTEEDLSELLKQQGQLKTPTQLEV